MSDLLNQASLVMIPSGYKEDTVFSQLPQDGSGDLSFTRASNGTRINSAGLVEVCPWNLFQQSEDFSNASWTKTNTTVTSNSITAPNGTLTADLIVPANATDGVIVQASLSFIVGTSYSLSVYGKKEDFNFLLLALPSSAFPTSNRVALFDLNNGTIASSTQSGTGAVITDVGNGWYRCSITITATATTSANVVIAARSSNNLTSLGNGTDGIFIWGAQLNIGSTAKPYFPTTDRLNVPRLTYQNGGGGCPSLLLEPQRTNIALRSEEFDNASSWTLTNSGTITANSTISPDGTQTADTLNAGANSAQVQQAVTGISGAVYTVSIWIKRITGTGNVFLRAVENADTLIAVTSDWQRFTATVTSTTTTIRIGVKLATSGDAVAIWGGQLEASSYPTSYIPTTSSSATRVADACSKTGISSLIGQTEGTIFLDAYFDDLDTVNFSISDGTSGNYVLIDSSSGAVVFARVQQGGATQATINTSASFYTVGARLKCAIAYKANDFAFYINGTLIGTDNSGSVPACDQIRFARWNGVVPATQRVNEVITFKTRLTNAELAQLTA